MEDTIRIECAEKIFKDVDMYIHSIELKDKPHIEKIYVCVNGWVYNYQLVKNMEYYYYITC